MHIVQCYGKRLFALKFNLVFIYQFIKFNFSKAGITGFTILDLFTTPYNASEEAEGTSEQSQGTRTPQACCSPECKAFCVFCGRRRIEHAVN